MRKLWLVFATAVFAYGCGGSAIPNAQTARFAGTWNGTWINVNQASDAGTSTWTISADGAVDGHDFDSGRNTTFHVVGTIDNFGNLISNSTPVGGTPATLNGSFTFSQSGPAGFSGILAWGVTPPLDYRYSFQRQ